VGEPLRWLCVSFHHVIFFKQVSPAFFGLLRPSTSRTCFVWVVRRAWVSTVRVRQAGCLRRARSCRRGDAWHAALASRRRRIGLCQAIDAAEAGASAPRPSPSPRSPRKLHLPSSPSRTLFFFKASAAGENRPSAQMVELSLNPRRLPADQTSGPVVDAQLTHSADTWPGGGGGSCLGRRSARASCAARLGYQAFRCNNDSCSVLRRPAAACGRAGLAEKRTVCGPPSTSHSSAMRCQLRQRCSRQRASTRCTVPSTRVASSRRPSKDCVSLCLRQWFMP
jgi:hypothetical protein